MKNSRRGRYDDRAAIEYLKISRRPARARRPDLRYAKKVRPWHFDTAPATPPPSRLAVPPAVAAL